MSKFRKKSIVIEAIQFTGTNSGELHEFSNGAIQEPVGKDYMEIETLEGVMRVSLNDYVIKGINGEFYPCKPDIFDKTYEKADTEKTFMEQLQADASDLLEKTAKLSDLIHSQEFKDTIRTEEQNSKLISSLVSMAYDFEQLFFTVQDLAFVNE